MVSMYTLREIIEKVGPTKAGRDLGITSNYASMLAGGKRHPSSVILQKAMDAWGALFDLERTVREHGKSDDAEEPAQASA